MTAKKSVLSIIILFFILMLLTCGPHFPNLGPEDNADIPIFPDAAGYGAYTHGGRNGEVIYVTTLEDTWEEGSLRYALSIAEGPRIVLFKVSGIIELSLPEGNIADIVINEPYVTVAGQTAPGDGICIKNGGIQIETHNVVIQYLKIRPGDGINGLNPEDRDAIKILHGYNIMIDHVSASWAIDEVMSTWYKPFKITFQNCIISEGLFDSLHPKGPHSRGLLVGDHAERVSIYKNVFIHNNRRNPLIKGDTKNIDFVNNIVYNWGNITTSVTGKGTHFSDSEGSGIIQGINIMNNLYIPGPSSHNEPLYQMSNFYKLDSDSTIYIGGNYILNENDEYIDAITASSEYQNNIDELNNYLINSPETPIDNMNINDATLLYDELLDNVGAVKPARDDVDQRVIQDLMDRTGSIINAVIEVGGYPDYNSTSAPTDTDNDGMPDDWETDNGFNPNDPADGNGDADGDGYTNIEEYLLELTN
jgi:hypothetical protein